MRQLYGLYQPDEGHILINNKEVNILSPLDAIHYGIGMVHQHFMLVPSLTVAENVALGLRSTREPFLDLDKVSARIKELSKEYGLKVNPNAYVWQLSVGEQQRVEIIKALYRGASLLILDEPTAVLTPLEVDELFKMLRILIKLDHAIIFISHKLHEVLSISNRIMVLRDGRVVGSLPTKNATKKDLACLMVGREVFMNYDKGSSEIGDIRFQVNDLWLRGIPGENAIKGVSFMIRSGEILGLAGVSGNGQKELAEALSGINKAEKGSVYMDKQEITNWSPSKHHAIGIAYIPEERIIEGCIKEFSVQENLILIGHNNPPFSRGSVFLDFKAIQNNANQLIKNYDIKTPSINTSTKSLSGGNIQKMILARELSRHPKVIIASQPTRGVDIGASEYIHTQLLQQRSEGASILLISEDLDEIRALSDRIAVIYEGRLMGITENNEVTLEQLGLWMAGVGIENP